MRIIHSNVEGVFLMLHKQMDFRATPSDQLCDFQQIHHLSEPGFSHILMEK